MIGKVPVFNEVFIDEGDVDMQSAIAAYRDAGFTGVITPDHTPPITHPHGMLELPSRWDTSRQRPRPPG